jgi:uncharacterized protein
MVEHHYQRDNALVIMARAPIPGLVKTRLCPPLTPESACDLYQSFLLDKAKQTSLIGNCDIYITCTPEDEHAQMMELAGNCRLMPQQEASPGSSFASCAQEVLGAGYKSVLLVAGDTPTLATSHFSQAFKALQRPDTDIVVGATYDGGYYLIGLKNYNVKLFHNIKWGAPSVLRQTVDRANGEGLRIHYLPAWRDVDTEKDLALLTREFANPSVCARAPKTRDCLRRLGLL